MDDIMNIFGNPENLWNYITKYAAKAGREGARIALQLFYVVKSPNTPMLDKAIIIAALAYQFLPEDMLPRDQFGILGFLDNGLTLAVAYNRVKARVTPEIENQVDTLLEQWFGPDNTPQLHSDNNPSRWLDESRVPSYDTSTEPISTGPNRPVFKSPQTTLPITRPTLSDDDVIVD